MRVAQLNIFAFLIIFERVFGDFCRLPNNDTGECVPLNDCEELKKLASIALSNQNYRAYFAKFQCKEPDSDWVCCKRPTIRFFANEFHLPTVKGGCGRQFTANGNVPNRIVGGEETSIGEFPWNVLIVYDKPNGLKGYYCGGSLITSMHVLTAAHCVSRAIIPSSWNITKVRLGEKDLSTDADCEVINNKFYCAREIIDADIEKIIIHELHSRRSEGVSPHDIAVIKLSQDVESTEFVRPICLPLNSEVNGDLGSAVVSGFGKTESGSYSERLIKAEINIVNQDECGRVYAIRGLDINYHSQICARGANADTCKGDSGGGLIKQDESSNTWYLIGITSFGPNRCRSELPGVYVNVKNYINWIREKINE